MTRKIKPTRRTVLAAAGAALAAPAVSLAPAVAGASAPRGGTRIAGLWAQARELQRRMKPYATEIADLSERAGLPGWMHLSGDANRLGHRRYDALVTILKTRPETLDDLATLGQVTREAEIRQGPATWARFQFDNAAREFHLAA